MCASDFRKRAMQSLKGNWGVAILVVLLYGIVVGLASSIPFAALVITGPLEVGIASVFLSLARREKTQMEQMLDGTKDFVNTFLAGLLVSLYTFLWSLLFIVPGIIKQYAYSMTFYILRDNPGMPASVAMKRSEEMMRGYKWKLFCLQFSFIGWYLLCMLTFGILLIFVAPYERQATAEFYRNLNAEPDYYAEDAYGSNQNTSDYQM